MSRQVSQHITIDANSGALHAIEQRREGQFDFAVDIVEIFFMNRLTEHWSDLRRQVSDLRSLPCGFIPAIVSRAAALNAAKLARQIV